MRFARSLTIVLIWAGILSAPVGAQQRGAPSRSPADAPQLAFDALRARPWYGQFKAVLSQTTSLGVSKLDGSVADIWLESEALGEAAKRIEDSLKAGRQAPSGAVNDAIDLDATGVVTRAGCFAALMEAPEFAPQAAALAALRVNGRLPEPIAQAVKQYAQGPCGAPQVARSFEPRLAWEGGKKLMASALAGGTMPPLARFLDERQLLSGGAAQDQARLARQSVEADFKRFDALYEGHSDLLRSYRGLLGDYCSTDQRFCALRDMLTEWSNAENYCGHVTRYIEANYGDATRIRYLDGAENDGLNRAWEAYHLKFAASCIVLAKRSDLVAASTRRLDAVAPMFADDQRILGDDGVARVREALRAVQSTRDDAGGEQARIAAYRAAVGLDGRGGSPQFLNGAPAGVTPQTPATPSVSEGPSDADLQLPGSAATERDLKLDRVQVRDIQERLIAIGSTVYFSSSMNSSTRSALRSWQGAIGLDPTGYFTRAQYDLFKLRTQDRWVQWRLRPDAATEPPVAVGRQPTYRRDRPPREARRRYRDDDVPYERGLIPARPSPFGGFFR